MSGGATEELPVVEIRLTLDDLTFAAQLAAGSDPEIDDIGYYGPSGDLVLYYGDVGYWPGIVRIGRLAASDMKVVERQPDGFEVTIDRG